MSIEKTLKQIFAEKDHNLSVKFAHFVEVYESMFSSFRGKAVNVVEIGVDRGGSLQVWSRYFGDQARIYGIDISYGAVDPEWSNISVWIGSQSSEFILEKIKNDIQKIDIFIDDGSHEPEDQIKTFDAVFPLINPNGGLYVCEDLHHSYQEKFYGISFVSHLKDKIDDMNRYHKNLSFFFYPFLVIIKKGGHDLKSPIHYGVHDV